MKSVQKAEMYVHRKVRKMYAKEATHIQSFQLVNCKQPLSIQAEF